MRFLFQRSSAVIDRRYGVIIGIVAAALFPGSDGGFARAASPRTLLLDGALAGSTVVAVGERGTLLRSSDQARTWQLANTPTPATLTGVTFAPGSERGWAVGHDAVILVTSDHGRTWIRQYQGENLEDSFLDVIALDARRVIAIGAYGLYLETADGGKNWKTRKIRDDDYHLNRIARGPTGTLYLAGEHGTLLRSTNDGRRWTAIPAPYEGSFYGILPLDRRTLLACGLRGHVYRSIDDGETWEVIPTPQSVLLAAAVRTKGHLVLVAGHPRGLLISRDLGKSFSPAADPPATAIAELLELPDGAILALGEAGANLIEVGRIVPHPPPQDTRPPQTAR